MLLIFALAGRSVLKHNKADRAGVAELVASGKGWVEVVNLDFLMR